MKHALTLAKPVWGIGKHVVITGGSSGIGFEVAKRLNGVCRKISLIARNENGKLAEAKETLLRLQKNKRNGIHTEINTCAMDVRNIESAQAWIGDVYSKGKDQIDIFVSSAGGSHVYGTLEEMTMADINAIFDVVTQHQIDDFHSPFVFYEPGFNLRSTDLNAFIGIGQLDKLDWMTEQRRVNHGRYLERLSSSFYVQRPPQNSQVASISVGLLAESRRQRQRIVQALAARGIETRIFSAGNLGLHPFWTSRYGMTSFPVADRIHHCGFFLPNHAALTPEDIATISQVVLEAA